MFTNPPPSLPTAGPDLTADFSQEVHSEITSHVETFGTIRSGELMLHGLEKANLNLLCQNIGQAV